jgi:protein PET117
MSTASKICFATTVAATLGIIYMVHNDQITDRARLHQGIVRDEERNRIRRKTENLVKLEQQKQLTKTFKKIEERSENSSTE